MMQSELFYQVLLEWFQHLICWWSPALGSHPDCCTQCLLTLLVRTEVEKNKTRANWGVFRVPLVTDTMNHGKIVMLSALQANGYG